MAKGECRECREIKASLSENIGICLDCLQENSLQVKEYVASVHAASRSTFGLPPAPPRHEDGIRCRICANECKIEEGGRGFCGLRTVQKGRLVHLAGKPRNGLLHWYRDPLPTNCVADWVCEGREHLGDHNLAIFYQSCTANCLFCQNWHYRRVSPLEGQTISSTQLASKANRRTFCACFFGGDPASQMPHAIDSARRLARLGVRICWETNGMMHPSLLDPAVEISLETGGCIKFDLKAFDEGVNLGLTGVSNKRILENFSRAAQRINERRKPPLLVASTLLVPGYVGANQVGKLAAFIASIDPNIPYALLAFAPNFLMSDLAYTTTQQALEAEAAAKAAGLMNVRIGNSHLLDST